MDAKEQAKAVLNQMLSWMENTEAAVSAGDWAEVGSQAKRLRGFGSMLRHVSEQAPPAPPYQGTPGPYERAGGAPMTAASLVASRILKAISGRRHLR